MSQTPMPLPAVPRKILLTPGPATTTDTVKYAQVVPDVCPRSEEFGELVTSVRRDLTAIVADPATHSAVLFAGSGTAAVEAMVGSVVGDGRLLVVDNGAYGRRIAEIAAALGLAHECLESPPAVPLPLDRLARALAEAAPRFTHLAVVHHETTTGLLNDVAAIGRLCREHGVELLVDAMSSYAAVPIDMREMGISYLASSSNKNLQGMPGISFVIADRAALARSAAAPRRTFYLDLHAQHAYFEAYQHARFTPPVSVLYALRQALDEAMAEGIENRYRRYSENWRVLLAGLSALGLSCLVPVEQQSRLLVTAHEPEVPSFDYAAMERHFAALGITTYPGKHQGVRCFRLGTIGALDRSDIELFIAELGRYLGGLGLPVRRARPETRLAGRRPHTKARLGGARRTGAA